MNVRTKINAVDLTERDRQYARRGPGWWNAPSYRAALLAWLIFWVGLIVFDVWRYGF
jgi:hypothetical protein